MTCIPLVNYALVIGISPTPSQETSAYKLYCYPHPLPKYEDSAIQILSFPPKRAFTDKPFKYFTHSFLITRENGSKYYGASLTLFPPTNSFKSSDFISNCIILISDFPVYTSLIQYLEDIQKFLSSPSPVLTLESYLHNIITDVSFSYKDNIISFHSPNNRTLYAILPSNEDLPLFQLEYFELCKFLNPSLLIKVITCILLEYNILIISDDPAKLNYFCETLISLIYPFTWNYPYVPILPSASVEFLDAPLPFFIGWLSQGSQDINSDLSFSGPYCQIDLSTSEIKVSDQIIPSLPFSEQLLTTLTQLYSTYLHPDSQSLQARQAQLSSLTELMSIVEVISNLKLEPDANTASSRSPSPVSRWNNLSLEEEHLAQLEFDCKLRELFYALFLNTFSDVVKFIIKPQPDALSLTRTFDKVAYLSEKCSKDRDFLTQFFETHIFTKFIDDFIEISSNTTADRHTTTAELFQYNISHVITDTSDLTYPIGTFNSTCKRYIHRMKNSQPLADTVCPVPSEISMLPPPDKGYDGLPPDSIAIPRNDIIKLDIIIHVDKDELSTNLLALTPVERESGIKNYPTYLSTAMELTELLKEAKHKTKQLITHHVSLTLRHHYEQDGAELSCAGSSFTGKYAKQSAVSVEDKGLISNLVEALEKIWRHDCRLSPDASQLWKHVLAYKRNYELDSQFEVKSVVSVEKKSSKVMSRSYSYTSDFIGRDGLQLKSSSRRRSMGAVSNPLVVEVQYILEQENIMTEIGRVRMWVKLLLEKRALKVRVEELLSLHSHLSDNYHLSAFLRTHGELEQLLYHLDSLSCVEFSCFTHDFPLCQLTYSLSLSLTRTVLKHTSVIWVLVSGSMGRTDVIKLDKGSNFCSFSCRNIGHILGVRVGHDNDGMNPDVFIQTIEVTSNLTRISYLVRANRKLCDSHRDDCVEYYFPAERFTLQSSHEYTERGDLSSEEIITETIRTRLQNSIRHLIHYFTEPSLVTQSLTYLVLGEHGFITLLLDLMLCDLVCKKHPYSQLWSLFSQISSKLRISGAESDPVDKFLTTCIKLEDYSTRSGPAEKIKVFLTTSLSQRILHHWIEVMSESKLTATFYKENSFFVNPELKSFLFGAVATLRSYQISVDPLFTLYID